VSQEFLGRKDPESSKFLYSETVLDLFDIALEKENRSCPKQETPPTRIAVETERKYGGKKEGARNKRKCTS
jgi:hypothetical protein